MATKSKIITLTLFCSNDSKGGKKRKKMTKDEFINNLRGIDQNNDIDR